MGPSAQTLLLIEDNADDIFIFERALKRAQIPNPLQVVRDGQEAVDYLSGAGRFADRERFPLPFLVLLDLKLPLKHGLDVLEWVRARPELQSMPVIVLTSSAERWDILRAHELGADAFLVKPPKSNVLAQMLENLKRHGSEASGETALEIEGDMLAALRRPPT